MRIEAAPLARFAATLAALLLGFQSATAQTVQSISPSTPDLSNVVSASSGDTVFRVSASTGTVTRVSGNGVRLGTGTTRALVTVACNVKACDKTNLNIRVGSIGSPTGRAGQLTNFTISSGTATIVTAPSGSNPVNFTIGPLGNPGTATFWVGADFPIRGNDAAAGTGNASSGFYVYVAASPHTPTSGSTAGLAVAKVFRPININALSPLAFGRILRPTIGSGLVSLNPSSGVRTVTGTGAIGLASPQFSRATYSVTGEGGQAFSIAYPSTFQMTGPGAPLVVTLTGTAQGAQMLSSALGSAGSFAFSMGGSFPISSTTATGQYQGSYAVTVQYN